MNDEDSLPWIDEFVACVERATLSHQNIEEAISIKQGYLPKRIYKYRRDCSYAVQNLEENTVWMANPDTYNDPYDCSFKVVKEKAMAEFLKTEHGKFIARTAKHDASVIAKYVNDSAESVRKIRDTTKICSFSDVSDSLLMWGHYAEEHKGFCIEYDLEVLDRNHEIRRNLYPVIYSSYLYDMTEYINGVTDAFAREYNPYAPLFSVLRKFEGWRYENEWRLVLFPHMLKPDFAQKLPKASRVMLGSRMKEPRKKAIQAICMDRNIDVWEMCLASEKFELVAKPYVAHSLLKR